MAVRLLVVAVGGALGSVLRYLTSLAGARLFGPAFPAGTLAVNLVGCFLAGLLFALVDQRGLFSPVTRLLLLTGFLGGLTTFSTFALDTTNLLRAGSWSLGLANFFTNVVGGLTLAMAGVILVRVLAR